MTSQPDKFFRDKLENFQQPAPSGAWDRIESNLARPSHKLIWIRIAAGVALLTATTFVLWPSEKPETEIATTKENVIKNDTIKQYPKAEVKEESVNEKIQHTTSPHVSNTATLASEKKINTVKDSVLITPAPLTHQLVAEIDQSGEKELTSKTIVYTTEEVNSKFLKKKLPPQATPNSQEASGIQKLIGLAYEAKNSEAPLGTLRQKKDDILALNFGKKKGEN